MKFSTSSSLSQIMKGDVVALSISEKEAAGKLKGICADIDLALGGALKDELKGSSYEKKDSAAQVFTVSGKRIVLIITPKKIEDDKRSSLAKTFISKILSTAKSIKAASISIVSKDLDLNSDEAFSKLHRAAGKEVYDFTEFKSGKKEKPWSPASVLLWSDERVNSSLKSLDAELAGVNLSRDLVSTPANVCDPQYLARTARKIGQKAGMTCAVKTKAQLQKLKAGGILSVGAGSKKPQILIELKYKPTRGRAKGKLALVGKGVTFDTGGYSIKVGAGMYGMKADMGGAATVLGIMEAVSRIKPNVEVHAFIPAVENKISEVATLPGDVIHMASGKTVEVLNTDAEGRLILADALHFASKINADYVIDFATLTGACMIALGTGYAGLFCNDDELACKLQGFSKKVDNPAWNMPLPDEYKSMLDSTVADIKNIGPRYGSAISAALFLQHFVGESKWAHFDIAGPICGSGETPDIKAGGFGVPAILELIADMGGK